MSYKSLSAATKATSQDRNRRTPPPIHSGTIPTRLLLAPHTAATAIAKLMDKPSPYDLRSWRGEGVYKLKFGLVRSMASDMEIQLRDLMAVKVDVPAPDQQRTSEHHIPSRDLFAPHAAAVGIVNMLDNAGRIEISKDERSSANAALYKIIRDEAKDLEKLLHDLQKANNNPTSTSSTSPTSGMSSKRKRAEAGAGDDEDDDQVEVVRTIRPTKRTIKVESKDEAGHSNTTRPRTSSARLSRR